MGPPHEVLRALWADDTVDKAELDEVCPPQKTCRNMKDVTFDGYAESGSDLGSAWRELLASEGKLRGSSVRDLVLGAAQDQ